MRVEEFGEELMRGNAGFIIIIKATGRGKKAVKFRLNKAIGQGPAKALAGGYETRVQAPSSDRPALKEVPT